VPVVVPDGAIIAVDAEHTHYFPVFRDVDRVVAVEGVWVVCNGSRYIHTGQDIPALLLWPQPGR
jgi:hypothetical protein